MKEQNLSITAFDYPLPEARIARYPLAERDESRLLLYKEGKIEEDQYKNISAYLPAHSFLVFNNTRVIEARLTFEKSTGTPIEIFCLEPDDRYADITLAMATTHSVLWKCLVGGAKKWKQESLQKDVPYQGKMITMRATKKEKYTDHFVVSFEWNEPIAFVDVLHAAGAVPLPPYLNRAADRADKERYQTVYARHDGSVAAPTAGLHFTPRVFASFDKKNIHKDFVTLHVGAGTFKPVQGDSIRDHDMHAEFIDVTIGFMEKLLSQMHNPVIAVGTTSLRTIESLYWIGAMVYRQPDCGVTDLHVQQWAPYEKMESIPAKTSLQALLAWMQKNRLERLVTKTQIIIVPGYDFKITSGLVTNFHQPRSTLLLLVAALIGDDWKVLYDHALRNNFRFLSYGDGCLLFKKT